MYFYIIKCANANKLSYRNHAQLNRIIKIIELYTKFHIDREICDAYLNKLIISNKTKHTPFIFVMNDHVHRRLRFSHGEIRVD